MALRGTRRAVFNGLEPVDVLLISGQSNPAGANLDESTVPTHLQAQDHGIKVWTGLALETLHNGYNNRPASLGASLWGPEAQFAYKYRQDNPSKTLYIAKYAKGSTYLAPQSGAANDWAPSTGELFTEFKNHIIGLRNALRAQGKRFGRIIYLKGQ